MATHFIALAPLSGIVDPSQKIFDTIERVQWLGKHQYFVANFFAFFQYLKQKEHFRAQIDVVQLLPCDVFLPPVLFYRCHHLFYVRKVIAIFATLCGLGACESRSSGRVLWFVSLFLLFLQRAAIRIVIGTRIFTFWRYGATLFVAVVYEIF